MVSNSKELRNYFLAASKLASAVMWMLVGIVIVIVGATIDGVGGKIVVIIIGIAVVAVGVLIILANRQATEQQVDMATDNTLGMLQNRASEKLNMVDENLINPIVVHGFGAHPSAALALTADDMKKKGRFSNLVASIKSLFGKDDSGDPVWAQRLGTDEVIRSLLVQYTRICFGEDQLYVYIGNADISTGRIYQEETVEIFYRDITNVRTLEVLSKLYNRKTKSFIYTVLDTVQLRGNGIEYSINISTTMNRSYVDEEFTGMKNLIRDKKMA
ncbi:MAG: hypothetical protein LUH54_02560 [Firmicutes bacterium]|nr:hypothetical protein [Bacillota bacterium]